MSSISQKKDSSSSTSGTRTPLHQSAVSYFSYPVTHVVSGLYRRLTDPNITKPSRKGKKNKNMNRSSKSLNDKESPSTTPPSGILTPNRTASPFQPPPLTPITLAVGPGPQHQQQQLLTPALAEEIRLLVPPRLQLIDTWRLAYSLVRDGASLATLYETCHAFSLRSPRAGYVLLVRDSSPSGTVFGAYMTDPPRPHPHYFGTGECFLWRACLLPRPTYNPQTTIDPRLPTDTTHASTGTAEDLLAPPPSNGATSGASTPERIRFKAFPYSGVNDYMMFCETGFLSLGGGDGHYGLWVDSSLEKGVSAPCQTFGNEPLSDEGVKFDILGVEVWYVGA